jgi:hypothetical protein
MAEEASAAIQVLDESVWSWMLYADGDRRVLAVLCGTVGLYERVIELDSRECGLIIADRQAIDELARRISGDPPRYGPRHQPHLLDSDAARAATARWRAERESLTRAKPAPPEILA